MNGIEKITARIASDAQAECDAVMAGAKAEAETLALRMVREADLEVEKLIAEGERAAAERAERLKSAAGMEARKLVLAAKQEMIAKVFAGAAEDLAALPEEELVKLIASLIAGASRTGGEQIVLSTADHTRFGKKVAEAANAALKDAGKDARLTLSASPRRIPGGGFMLSDGDVEINGAFSAIVAGLKAELTPRIANLLFD